MSTATKPKKKTRSRGKKAEAEAVEEPLLQSFVSSRLREIGALSMLLISLIGLLSLITYHPADIRGEMYIADGETAQGIFNWCGTVGAWTAHWMLTLIGYSSFTIVLVLMGWSAALFVRHEVRDMSLKLTGLFFLTIAGSAFLSLTFRNHLSIPTAGGLFGEVFAQWLLFYLGGVGAYLFVGLICMMAFILATDWMFYDVAVQAVQSLSRWNAARAERVVFAPEADEKKEFLYSDANASTTEDDDVFESENEETEEPQDIAVPPKPKPAADNHAKEIAASNKQLMDEQRRLEKELKRLEKEHEKELRLQAKKEAKAKKSKSKDSTAQPEADKLNLNDEGYKLPDHNLLKEAQAYDASKEDKIIGSKARIIEETLKSFNIDARVVNVDRGPVITQFELELAPGIKVNRILGLQDNLAMNLKAAKLRVIAPIPGKSTVGIELPNTHAEEVRLKELFDMCYDDLKNYKLPIVLGKDSRGEALINDLTTMPHMLIAGTTGSGKSVCLNAIILSLLISRKPRDVKLVMVDPKMVEMSMFKDIPHLMHPVVTDARKAATILDWIVQKMEDRYLLLSRVGTKNIANFNDMKPEEIRANMQTWCEENDMDYEEDKVPTHLPYIVVIVDELADMMMVARKEVESAITRLAQKSRAIGIHLILATQRPSVDVITGLIKANMPCRISFQVRSKIDSRTILDSAGAEKLIGKGDMLFIPPGSSRLIRAQAAYVDEREIKEIVSFVKQQADPVYEDPAETMKAGKGGDEMEKDELYDQAVDFIVETKRGSVSLLQRRLGIGYTRSSRLIDMMAQCGIVGPYKGAQAREVLLTPEEWEAQKKKMK